MDFSMIGSIGSYTKSLRLQSRWDQKKASGNVTAHMDAQGNIKPRKTEIASMCQQQIDEQNESGSDEKKLSEIMDKVSNGKKLTPEEEKILQNADPVIYARYRSVEDERKSYEQELKRCKTKDEVQRVKMAHMNNTMMSVKSIANNPNIPEDKKRTLLGIEKNRTEKLNAATEAFVKKGEYAKLPTDQEKQKAEKELRELKEAERKPDAEKTEEDRKAERTEDGHDKAENAEAEAKSAEAAEKETTPAAEKKSELRKAAEPKTEEQLAARSPELRKVRRAKSKAAYAYMQSGTEDAGPTLSIEA